MSKKSELKKAIEESEREIAALEQKLTRSQSSLMRAMITGKKPSKEDEHYFNVLSALIDQEREHLHSLQAELDALKK